MPDCLLIYTDNIHEEFNNRELFNSLHLVMAESTLFPLESIRSRAEVVKRYYAGDGNEANAFIHLTVATESKLNKREKEELGQLLLDLLQSEFGYSYQQLNCTIQVELREIPQENHFTREPEDRFSPRRF